MKVLISFPPLEGPGCPTLGQNRQFQWFHNPSYIYPMVPASAATLLKNEDHEVIWDDAIARGLTYEQWLGFVRKEKPDLIAIETKTPVVKQHWRIIEDIKPSSTVDRRPSTTSYSDTVIGHRSSVDNRSARFTKPIIVLMGDHVTALPEESMQNSPVDFVITGGDYDVQLLGLCRAIESTIDRRPMTERKAGKKGNNRNAKGLQNTNRQRPTVDCSLPPGIWYREDETIKNTGAFILDHDLNMLPFIDRELTEWYRYGEKLYKREPFTYTMAGRDCWWGRCTFCSWTTTFPKFRTRTPANLLDEIGLLIDSYGVQEIFDDTGTFPSGNWLREFCDGMNRRGYNRQVKLSGNFRFNSINEDRAKKMKQAGFRLLKLGLESANDATLKRLDKGTTANEIISGARAAKRAGIEVHLTCMIGYPWETKEDTYRTLNLARQMMVSGLADMLQATVIMPYPGTPLYQEAIDNDWLVIDSKDYDKFDMTKPVLKMPDMTAEEITEACQGIYRSFLRPKFLLRHMMAIRSPSDLRFLARGVKPVIGHIRDFGGRRKTGKTNKIN